MNNATKAEFDAFIANYPRPLEPDTLMICDPPQRQYNDFSLGVWPKSIVASYYLDDGRSGPAHGWKIKKEVTP